MDSLLTVSCAPLRDNWMLLNWWWGGTGVFHFKQELSVFGINCKMRRPIVPLTKWAVLCVAGGFLLAACRWSGKVQSIGREPLVKFFILFQFFTLIEVIFHVTVEPLKCSFITPQTVLWVTFFWCTRQQMVIPFWNRKVSSAIIDVVLLLVLLDVLEILHYPMVVSWLSVLH